MKRWTLAAALSLAAIANAQTASAPATPAQASPAKKQLVAKVLQLQQPALEGIARQLAQGPVLQMLQQANHVLRTQVPADKRDAAAKAIEADAKKYVDEVTPLLRERADKAAPGVVGALLEERFNEDELKQLIAWLESPVIRKYQQLTPEMQNSMMKKLVAESTPVLEPKLRTLQQRMRTSLGLPPPAANAGKPGAGGAAKPPAAAASK